MRKSIFSYGLLFLLIVQGSAVLAQFRNLDDSDRRKVERELERQLSRDTNESVRVRVDTAQEYSYNNRETGIRGVATMENRRGSRNEIWYDMLIDLRSDRVSKTDWGYGRNPNVEPNNNRRYEPDRQPSGPLPSGRYEIQLVATKRQLVAGSNGQVVQSNSGNTRSRQWDIEDVGRGLYYVRSAETGEVMTVEGRGDNGSSIVLTNQRTGRDDQLWEVRTGPDNGFYFIATNGKSMDSPSSARFDGGRMQVYSRNGEANQRFWLRRVGDLGYDPYDSRNRDRYNDRNRNDNRFPPGREARSGSLSWRGRVDDVIELEVQGNRVYERVISGKPVSSVRTRFDSSLPRSEVNVDVQLRRGRGKVEMIEQPSSRNNYRAIIRITDSQGGADNYEIDIAWN